MKTETKTIALGNISEAPWNPRGEITNKSVEELAQTMNENGLTTPITLGYVKEDGNTYLIAGHRRLAAARLLGWKSIPYTLTEYETIAAAKMATFNDNDQHVETDPFVKCRQIVAMLDAGVPVKDVARRMARSPKWVERCRPIVEIVDANDGIGDKLTVGTIAQIAAMPEKVRGKLVKDALNRVGYCYGRKVSPSDIRWDVERELRNLDGAVFDTEKCKACEKRTGAQADLFGETDGKLGKCLDCKCYDKCVKEWTDAKIAEAVQGAEEVVRVQYSYQMPDYAKATKPSKRNPCAYVYVYGDEVTAMFGPSKKQMDAERKAHEAELAEKRKVEDAARERETAIGEHFHDYFCSDVNHAGAVKAIKACIAKPTKAQLAWIAELIADNWSEIWDDDAKAEVLQTFPFTRDLCGIPKDDAKWYIERNLVENENE